MIIKVQKCVISGPLVAPDGISRYVRLPAKKTDPCYKPQNVSAYLIGKGECFFNTEKITHFLIAVHRPIMLL